MTEFYKDLVKHNDSQYNYLKLIEELAELQEVLIKRVNKSGHPKCPSKDMLCEEIGDVMLRIQVLVEQEQIKIPVMQRIMEKSSKLTEYMKQGKYKGHL